MRTTPREEVGRAGEDDPQGQRQGQPCEDHPQGRRRGGEVVCVGGGRRDGRASMLRGRAEPGNAAPWRSGSPSQGPAQMLAASPQCAVASAVPVFPSRWGLSPPGRPVGPLPRPLFSRSTCGESPSLLRGCVYRCPRQGSSVRPLLSGGAPPRPPQGCRKGLGRAEPAGPAPKSWVVSCLCPWRAVVLGRQLPSCALGPSFGKGCGCSFSALRGGRGVTAEPWGPGGAGLQSSSQSPRVPCVPQSQLQRSRAAEQLTEPPGSLRPPVSAARCSQDLRPCHPALVLSHAPPPPPAAPVAPLDTSLQASLPVATPRAHRDLQASLPWTVSSSHRLLRRGAARCPAPASGGALWAPTGLPRELGPYLLVSVGDFVGSVSSDGDPGPACGHPEPEPSCGLALSVSAPARTQLNAWARPSPGARHQHFLGAPPCLGPLAGSKTILAKAQAPAWEQREPGWEWSPFVPWPHSVPSKALFVRSPGHGRSSGQPGHWEGWAWRPRSLFLDRGSLLWARLCLLAPCPCLHEAASVAPARPALWSSRSTVRPALAPHGHDGLRLRTCRPGRFPEMLDWGCSRVQACPAHCTTGQ